MTETREKSVLARKYAVVFASVFIAATLWVGDVSSVLANGQGNDNSGGGRPTPPTTAPSTTLAPTTTTTTTTTLAPTTTQAPATTQAPETTAAPTTTPATTAPPTTSPSTPVISLKASATSVNEGDSSTGNSITFTIENRVNGSLATVSSNTSIAVTGSGLGSCGQGAIAQLQSGPIRIDRNTSSTTFTVTTCGDTNFEPNDESLTVSITAPSGFSPGKSSETITVVADDLTAANTSGSVDNSSFASFDVRDLVQVPTGSSFTVQFSQPALGGTVSTASSGFIAEFTPALGYTGSTSFTYTATDSRSSKTASGTITVTVTGAPETTSSTVTTEPPSTDPNDASTQNLAPTAPAYTFSTDNALTALVAIDVLEDASDDRDKKSDLTIELGALSDSSAGVVSALVDSTFTFKPFPDYVGEVTISYSLTDTEGLETFSTITITITRVPLIPVDDSLTVASGSTARVAPLENDRNLGLETLTITTSEPTKGTVTVTGNVIFYQHTGKAAKDDTDTFTYSILDAGGRTLGTGTVNVSIQPNRGVIKIRDITETVLIETEVSSGNNNDPKICKAVVEATNLFNGTAYTLQILEQGGKNSVTTLTGLMPGTAYHFGSASSADPATQPDGLQIYIGHYLDKGASYKVTLTAEGSTDSISSKVFATCPPPDTRISDATIVEGDSGSTTLSFDISTTGWASYTTTATISESTGPNAAQGGPSCAEGVDFIDPGPTEIQVVDGRPTSFEVTVCSETVYEDDELFTVNLTSTNPDVNFLDPSATGTIENDEVITLSIGNAERLELDSGSEDLSFTITAYDNGNDPVDIDLVATISAGTNGRAATRGGACSTDIDFVTPETNPLSVTKGQHTFTVSVCGDSDYENGDETFQVVLSVAGSENVYRSADVVVDEATGTILEDDGVVLTPVTNDDSGSDNADSSTLTLFYSPSAPERATRTYIVNVTNRTADTFTVELEMNPDRNLTNVDWSLSTSNVTVGPNSNVPVTITVTAPHRSSLRDVQRVTVNAKAGDDKTDTYLDLTIRRRLEVTANNAARKYLNRNPNFTMSFEGFINNDAPGETALLNAARTCGSAELTAPVGTHTITCDGTRSTDLYDVVYLPGRLTIERRPVTVLATSFTRPQNQGNPTLTYSVIGVPESEIPSITCSTSANGAAGRFPITCQTSAVLSSNLDVSFVPGTMTVTPVESPTTTAPATTAPTTTSPPTTVAATTSAPPSTTPPPTTQAPSGSPTTAPPSTLPGGGVVIEVTQAPTDQDDEEAATPIETTDQDDIVDVKEGDKQIDTGGGDDKVSSGGGDDIVDGGEGADRIDTGDGDDTIDGGDGDDELVDFDGDNEMTGGGGDDKLVSGTAAGGTIDGGDGNDTFYKFVEREFDIDNSTELIGVENIVVVLFDCDQLPEYQALSTDELLATLNLESDIVPTVTIECRADPFTAPQLDINGEDTGLDLRLSDIFNGPSSDEYYMRKTFEEMVNIAWARVESQRPRFSNWIRQQGVDGVQTYCARTPFPCNPIKES